jgi:octaprenyl-diphosphate synthase
MDITETSTHRMFAENSGNPSSSAKPRTDSFASATSPNTVASADLYRAEFLSAIECIVEPLRLVEAQIRSELTSDDTYIAEMLQYVAKLGGKRLRPALTLLCASLVGPVTDESIRLATVVELVHTATLVHDDILDDAILRRHQPSVHVRWNIPASVLIGDWLFTHAYRLANDGDSTLPGRWVAQSAQRVCEGEIRQGNSIANWDLDEATYLKLLEDKTGALCGVSCALGAWSAGADLETCKILERFGNQLGIAFQLYDDWLDLWGDADRSGKTLGTDLNQLKPTMPLLRALSTWDAPSRTRWIASLERGDEDAVRAMQDRMNQCDASEYTLNAAKSRIREAVEQVTELASKLSGGDSNALRSLVRLAEASVSRAG